MFPQQARATWNEVGLLLPTEMVRCVSFTPQGVAGAVSSLTATESSSAVSAPVLCDGSDTNLHEAGGQGGSHERKAEWQMLKSSRNPRQPSKCPCKSRSFESTTPFTKFNHSGISSSRSSVMKNATHIQPDVAAFLLSQTNRKEHGGTQTTTRGTQLDPQRWNASRTHGRLSQRHQQICSTQSKTCCWKRGMNVPKQR